MKRFKQAIIDELPFNVEGGGNAQMVQLDATPEIRLISKPIN